MNSNTTEGTVGVDSTFQIVVTNSDDDTKRLYEAYRRNATRLESETKYNEVNINEKSVYAAYQYSQTYQVLFLSAEVKYD